MSQFFKVCLWLSLNRFLLFVLDVSFDFCIVLMLSLVDLLTQVPISLLILHLWHQIINLSNLFSFSFRSLSHSLWNSRHDHLMHTLILNSIVSILQDFPHHLLERPFPGRFGIYVPFLIRKGDDDALIIVQLNNQSHWPIIIVSKPICESLLNQLHQLHNELGVCLFSRLSDRIQLSYRLLKRCADQFIFLEFASEIQISSHALLRA